MHTVPTLAAFPADRWIIERPIGQGGQSETFLAHDAATGQKAALKRLHGRHVADLKQLELFFREAEVLRSLHHPCIPRILDAFVVRNADGTAEMYLAQTWIDGADLRTTLATSARPDAQQVIQWLGDLLGILTYLHDRLPPVIHRDIKPSNIIIRPDGRAVLVDFGAAASGFQRDDASTVVGTPGYAAPEQFMGVVSPRVDLYALGAVVWHIATGKTPTVDPMSGRIVPPEGLDPALSAFILAVTASAPADRPRSAAEAREILARPAPVMNAPNRDATAHQDVREPPAPAPAPSRPRPWQRLPPAPRAVTPEWHDLVASLAAEDARAVVPHQGANLWPLGLGIIVLLLGFLTSGVTVIVLATVGIGLLLAAHIIVHARNERIHHRAAEFLAAPATGHRTLTFVDGEPVLCPVVDWTEWRPFGVDTNYSGFGKLAFAVPDLSDTLKVQTAVVSAEFGEACQKSGVVPVLMRPGVLDAIIVMEP